MEFDIEGKVTVQCDRCLDDCDLPVNYRGELAVKFTDEDIPESERYDGEVLWLGYNENTLNVAQYIYESIVLSLPYQRVHSGTAEGTGGCDPEMLEKFRIVTQEEFDRLTGPQQEAMAENPEWEKLRRLKEEME
ncbi:MAG: DUF177 domain-containing protein [Rikenellaceae bacterium]|nr:DUF177 domain-containing protein [Rikenellaceae bacterium]